MEFTRVEINKIQDSLSKVTLIEAKAIEKMNTQMIDSESSEELFDAASGIVKTLTKELISLCKKNKMFNTHLSLTMFDNGKITLYNRIHSAAYGHYADTYTICTIPKVIVNNKEVWCKFQIYFIQVMNGILHIETPYFEEGSFPKAQWLFSFYVEEKA